MANIEDLTGSVDVNADITPTFRIKIDQVTPNMWHTMSPSALVDERSVLHNRMMMASECGYIDIVMQIQKGIDVLDALISK